MSTRRMRLWLIIIPIVMALYYMAPSIDQELKKEKTPITVCAPENMQKAFEKALSVANMKAEYKIVMTSDKNADICVDYGKKDDSEYIKFAFSPFVIGYSANGKYIDKLKNSKVIVESEYDDRYNEIDFLKVVNEVIGEGQWANLGIDDLNGIKIFYPDRESIYWQDFYDFMLVTVNNGAYPRNSAEMEKAAKIIEQFEISSCTEATMNFEDKSRRIGGFPENVFYVLPENVAYFIPFDKEIIEILFPTLTVYFNYYVKGNELGSMLTTHFRDSDSLYNDMEPFFSRLSASAFRSERVHALNPSVSGVEGERDVFNVAKIPKNDNLESTPKTSEESK